MGTSPVALLVPLRRLRPLRPWLHLRRRGLELLPHVLQRVLRGIAGALLGGKRFLVGDIGVGDLGLQGAERVPGLLQGVLGVLPCGAFLLESTA